MVDIHLHIERVILEGFDLPAEQHGELQATLASELTRLLAEGGLAPSLALGGAYDRAPAGRMALPDQPEPGGMGRQIAGVVVSGLSRGAREGE